MPETNRPEVLVIEGCDLSGKTHLWDAVIKAFPGLGMKITARPLNSSTEERKKIKGYYESVLSFININYQSKTIILDRFFPSEMVYSLPKRGYESMNDHDLERFESVLKHRKHLLLYCDPTLPVLYERLETRGDDYIQKEDIEVLYKRYQKFLNKTTLNYLRLDTTLPVEQLIEQIKQYFYEYKGNNR